MHSSTIRQQNPDFQQIYNFPFQMSKKQMTLIYYHISEDNDDPQYPNVFGIMMNKQNVRLQHLYDNFPLKGAYIFRFKVMYDNSIAWLDLPDLQTKLPTYKQKIMVKATRISWETSKQNPYGHYRFLGSKSNTQQQPKQQSKPIKVQQPKSHKKVQVSSNLLDEKEDDLI